MSQKEKAGETDVLSPIALDIKRAVQTTFEPEDSMVTEGSWAIVAKNGRFCIFKGEGARLMEISVFFRPDIPDEPTSFLESLGTPDERSFYSVPSEVFVSIVQPQATSLAIIPGIDLKIQYSETNGMAAVSSTTIGQDNLDFASLLQEAQTLLAENSPRVYLL